jgi:hypothetical protein
MPALSFWAPIGNGLADPEVGKIMGENLQELAFLLPRPACVLEVSYVEATVPLGMSKVTSGYSGGLMVSGVVVLLLALLPLLPAAMARSHPQPAPSPSYTTRRLQTAGGIVLAPYPTNKVFERSVIC